MKTVETKKQIEKAVLMGVIFDSRENLQYQLDELAGLAHTAEIEVVGVDSQLIREVTPSTLIGSGKLEELKNLVESTGATMLVVDAELTGSQVNHIEDVVGVKVIDRIRLILDIFAMRANSQEGRLQVELAQLKYSLPRLSSIQGSSGRFGSGGVGMRGPGETKLEMDKRLIIKKINAKENEIKSLKDQRFLKRKNRVEGNKKQVAIVGYTNAGKSTLLNLISKAGIYADDKLFATLDTTSRAVYLSPEVQIILTDTVGFISKLPHYLVDAFASTLEEAIGSDLILHVVDVSNKHYKDQMQTVNNTLKQIGADKIPQIILYNKTDKIGATPMIALKENELLISAKNNEGITELKDLIIKAFQK